MAKTTVLFIAGWGRSGSTIIGNVLGQLPGFFHVGEIGHVWRRAIIEDANCGLAGSVLRLPGVEQDPWRSVRWRRGVLRLGDARAQAADCPHAQRFVPRRPDAERGRASGANGGNRVRRDGRAVVWRGRWLRDQSSHRRFQQTPGLFVRLRARARLGPACPAPGPRPARDDLLLAPQMDRTDAKGTLAMERFSVLESASRWVSWNAAVPMVAKRTGLPVTRIHYESFVRRTRSRPCGMCCPSSTTSARSHPAPCRWSAHEVELRRTHTVWGNPSRQQTGRVAIKPDSEWSTALGRGTRHSSPA